MTGNVAWIGLGLVAAISAAGVTLFGRVAVATVDVALATTLRSVIMTAVLVLVSLTTGSLSANSVAGVPLRSWTVVSLAGLCGAISWLAYFAALRIGMAGQVAAIDRLSIVFVFVLGVAALGERYSWRGWCGLAAIVAGVILIASERSGAR